MNRFNVGLPATELVLGVIEHLASFFAVLERSMGVSRNNRRVVKKVEYATCLLGQDDLLLRPLDSRRKVDVVSFLELLARLTSQQNVRPLVPRTLTMLVNCASATKLCASARTSSCSSWTILVLCGSLYLSLAISSDT